MYFQNLLVSSRSFAIEGSDILVLYDVSLKTITPLAIFKLWKQIRKFPWAAPTYNRKWNFFPTVVAPFNDIFTYATFSQSSRVSVNFCLRMSFFANKNYSRFILDGFPVFLRWASFVERKGRKRKEWKTKKLLTGAVYRIVVRRIIRRDPANPGKIRRAWKPFFFLSFAVQYYLLRILVFTIFVRLSHLDLFVHCSPLVMEG